MDIDLRRRITEKICSNAIMPQVVKSISISDSGTGTISYNLDNVWIDPNAPGFINGTTHITDEEMVRAYLLSRLVTHFEYPATLRTLELEKVYKPVGRPQGKGGRVDVIIRRPSEGLEREAFLFIECKAPDKFDEDLKYVDGQLFRLSRQETLIPRFLVYYTVELKGEGLRERVIVIDTNTFPDYESWDHAGQPITDVIPKNYGIAQKRRFANVAIESDTLRPLDREATAQTFNRLRTEIHEVIWAEGEPIIMRCSQS